ncbi:MAG: hypothetical protein KC503_45050 [Myxococcales bacterium]|nr:hypothetical protein [Myxococcales bacterium]
MQLRPGVILCLCFCLWSCSCLCVGCSSRPTPNADASASPDALAPDVIATPDAARGPFEGLIYIAEIRDSRAPGSQQGTALATFTEAPHPFFAAQRTITAQCSVYGDEGESAVQFSAGRLQFVGGTLAFELAPKQSPPKPGTYLYPGLLNPDYFAGGDTITVIADGAELPQFKTDVHGVYDLDVTFPGALTRGKPTQLAWTTPDPSPSPSDTVWVLVIGAVNGRTSGNGVRCSADLAAGAFEIPAQVLDALPPAADAVVLAVGQRDHVVHKVSADLTVNLVTTNLISSVHALR